MEKVIRIWADGKVVLLLSVRDGGGYSVMGATGGAANSTKVDIELDPWSGLIVDHSTANPPVGYREPID